MASKTSILLIIRQNPNIKYNELLSKVRSKYSNLNSARAALSRALKELSSFGYVEKINDSYVVTEKGNALINSETKSKLIIKLNQLISRGSYADLDSIVKHLHTLIERSREDKELLKVAKGSVEFYISDLEKIRDNVEHQIKHLNYLENILASQIKTLKELGFNDARFVSYENFLPLLKKLPLSANDEVIIQAEEDFLEYLANKLEGSLEKEGFIARASSIKKLISLARPYAEKTKNEINLLLKNFMFKIAPNGITIISSSNLNF